MPPKQYLNSSLAQASNRFAILDILDDEHEFSQIKNSAAMSMKSKGNGTNKPDPRTGAVDRSKSQPQGQVRPSKSCQNESLCAQCQSIFLESQKLDEYGDCDEQLHHFSYSSFKKAIDTGCYICSLLDQKIRGMILDETSTLPASDTVEQQFEDLRYQIMHEALEPNVYFSYHKRNGKTHHRVLGLQLFPSSEVEDILHTTPIPKSTSSNQNLGLLRRWLLKCCNEHEECGHKNMSDSKLPTRLIAIGKTAGVNEIRLCDGASLSQPTSYFTLSHCWGRKPIFTLLRSNIDLLSKNIEIEKLPKVFQDAIVLTQRLGYNYIWIDSLCIIQDSNDDWLKEAPQMGDVYRNATCNLAATGFHDGQNGLFVTRNERLISTLKVYVRWEGMSQNERRQLSGQYHLWDNDLWHSSISNAPLNHRAWVVQERIISPRIVHFGAKQLFWECHQLKASEAFPEGFDYKVLTGNNLKRKPLGSSTQESYRYWTEVVEAYSKGRLTFSHDKLSAIAGIAMDLWKSLRDRYIAGHWEGNLIHSLLWTVYQTKDFIGLPSEYRAPTWSWASIDAEVSYMHAKRNADLSHKGANHPEEVIHSSTVEVFSSFFPTNLGSITVQWTLRIKGPLRQAMRVPEVDPFPPFWTLSLPRSFPLTGLKRIELKLFLDIPSSSDKYVEFQETDTATLSAREESFVRSRALDLFDPAVADIFLLPIRSDWEDLDNFQVEMYGLGLYPTGRKRGEFQRIGCFVIEEEGHRKAVLDAPDVLQERYFEESNGSGQYTITIV